MGQQFALIVESLARTELMKCLLPRAQAERCEEEQALTYCLVALVSTYQAAQELRLALSVR